MVTLYLHYLICIRGLVFEPRDAFTFAVSDKVDTFLYCGDIWKRRTFCMNTLVFRVEQKLMNNFYALYCLDNVGSLAFHNPIGLQGLLRG
jgi:hypothetical protein